MMNYLTCSFLRSLALSLMVLSICNKSSNNCASTILTPSKASCSKSTSPRSRSNVFCSKAILKRLSHASSAAVFSWLIWLSIKAGVRVVTARLVMIKLSVVYLKMPTFCAWVSGAQKATTEASPDLFPNKWVLYSSHSRHISERNHTPSTGVSPEFFCSGLLRPLLTAYLFLLGLSMTVKKIVKTRLSGAKQATTELSPDLFPAKVLYSSHARQGLHHTLFHARLTQGAIYGR